MGDCAIWDSDKQQCLIKSSLQGYIKQSIFVAEGMKMVGRVNREIDNEENE